ncbi:vWA domain-containing protein [Stigmatella erecta]|uniref:Ca-activated chloride channel family protein n=1 Tax=Stigmatella erecta TaxID=83460 RepID=A0A1I0AD35_9BACT|nr:von Willebrand factor type A domain-containing protein [Stigmatella erecta]SES92131.1 Ca-activated chloride channel family protein [Stigmatella erecta]
MSPSTLYRLSLWGSAFLGLSLLPSCLSAKAPAAEIALAQEGAAHQEEQRESAPAAQSADTLAAAGAVGVVSPALAPPPPPPSGPVAPAPLKREAKAGKVAPGHAREASAKFEPEPRSEKGNTFEAQQPHTFTVTREDALSTFAADVDTASYTLARRYLNQGSLPPPAAVRVEEFVNYFSYRYAPPAQGAFTVHLEGAPSPFTEGRHFLRVGVQGKVVSRSQRKPAHLVFLVDTSGSMQSEDKLPLAKEAMKVAVKNLNENDTVALVTYAGSTQDVLPPTPATEVQRIHAAIDGLRSGGGTAMGSGMELAYRHAVKKASAHAVSRVIVLTDGDANIGPNLSADAMLSGIGKYVAEGVTLSTIGFGMGNYRDDLMERLADQGNGNCFYVDSFQEAKKVFEAQLTGTLEVIAKDVKLQVEFNPEAVRRYRLVGYENRDVADRDFRNDKVDAGEIGAGHTVTALYEVELTGEAASLAMVRIRAKAPNGTEAAEQNFPFPRSLVRTSVEAASTDFRFALAVASTADILRASPAAQGWSLAQARALAEGATEGRADRTEFVTLVSRAQALGSTTAERRD